MYPSFQGVVADAVSTAVVVVVVAVSLEIDPSRQCKSHITFLCSFIGSATSGSCGQFPWILACEISIELPYEGWAADPSRPLGGVHSP